MSKIDITGTRLNHDFKLCCNHHSIVARIDDRCVDYELRCSECNSRRDQLPKEVTEFLRESRRLFGVPAASIFIPRAMIRKDCTEMRRDDLFPSKYFKAADLDGKPLGVVIKTAAIEALKNMQGANEDKLVLGFANQKKCLVVNRTNFDAIAELHGDETDAWPGKRIELYPDKARVGGKVVACVRVRASLADALNDSLPI